MRNILNAFDEFAGNEILPQRALQDYQSVYIDLYQEIKPRLEVEKENVNSDIVFELELIKQIEVNIDYILMLVAKYHASNCSDRSILESIDRAINSSIELRSKKELIQGFISRVNDQTDVEADWQSFVRAQKEKDMSDIITEENLRKEPARMFMEGSLRSGVLKTTGTEFDRILPAISRFSGGDRAKKRQSVITTLVKFFEKYLGL
jgi:type I restriction enzyme R subunit